MKYILRDYQQECSDRAVNFFRAKTKSNGLLVVPTGAGKSLIIAEIASRLNDNVLVFQPSKEILDQNFNKLRSYGVEDCSIYSASFRSKKISRITFATIGSVKAHMEDFNHFRYIIVDECHLVNAVGGLYKDFFECAERKIIGLTATPYRLDATLQYLDANGKVVYRPKDELESFEFDNKIGRGEITVENKCILKFLTRTRPRIFKTVIHSVDISTLLMRGYLAKLRYFDLSLFQQEGLKRNSTGRYFDEKSLFQEYEKVDLQSHLVSIVKRLLAPKSGIPRNGILVFTQFLDESERLRQSIPGCEIISGTTKPKERDNIIKRFKAGEIKVLTNVGVLTTGFDYPELDTVVMARPTMSLALYYQIVGRAIRPHESKTEGWIVDLCGNYKRFGNVADLHLSEPRPGEYIITGFTNGATRQLTNTYF